MRRDHGLEFVSLDGVIQAPGGPEEDNTKPPLWKSVVPAVLFIAGLFVSPAYAAPQSCEQLARLALPHASITSAQTIAAGAFTPPANATPWLVGDPAFYKQLPAFCRVSAVSKPSPDSESPSHHLSQTEIGGDNPCSRHLSGAHCPVSAF